MRIHKRRQVPSNARYIKLRPDDVKPMDRKRFAKVAELLTLKMGIIMMGLKQSGIEDEHDDVLIREVNAFVRATATCLKEQRADWHV